MKFLTCFIMSFLTLTAYSMHLKTKTKIKTKAKADIKEGSVMTFFNKFFSEESNNLEVNLLAPDAGTPPQAAGNNTSTPSTANSANNTAANGSTLDFSVSVSPFPNGYVPPTPDSNNVLYQNWLKISSYDFRNKEKYPDLILQDGSAQSILLDQQNFRINDINKDLPDFVESSNNATSAGNNTSANAKTKYDFWFTLSGTHIYYSSSKSDTNVLGAISLLDILDAEYQTIVGTAGVYEYCFYVTDEDRIKYSLCADNDLDRIKWVCQIKLNLGKSDPKCNKRPEGFKVDWVTKITQPIILIPLASPMCNKGWNYNSRGKDWECTCKTGTDQSPIDLPSLKKVTVSVIKPEFRFETVPYKNVRTSIEGQLIENQNVKIKFHENLIRIFHTNFGRIVTPDGALYQGQEIVFHSPSDHTIDGQQFDLEMQVIMSGQTKGDIAKQVILSFLFKAKAGAYNKFLDDIDPYNLPNPVLKEKDINNDLYIPKVFYQSDDPSNPNLKSFSFYTYQGSIPFPPCTERTIHYVVADPIPLAKNVISMFTEALRVPDFVNKKTGDIYTSSGSETNNSRATQPLNGRPVFYYKGCDTVKPNAKRSGHYELVPRKFNNYVFVNGNRPSGLPGAVVVSENLAKGIPEIDLNLNLNSNANANVNADQGEKLVDSTKGNFWLG